MKTTGIALPPVITLESGSIEAERIYSIFSEHRHDMALQQLSCNPKTRSVKNEYMLTFS